MRKFFWWPASLLVIFILFHLKLYSYRPGSDMGFGAAALVMVQEIIVLLIIWYSMLIAVLFVWKRSSALNVTLWSVLGIIILSVLAAPLSVFLGEEIGWNPLLRVVDGIVLSLY